MQPLFPAPPALPEQLGAGMARLLTLLVTPAGYGKSTLLGRRVATHNWPVAWLALDTSDNDLACFVRHLIAASQGLDPDMPLLPGREALAPQDSLTEWLSALAAVEGRLCSDPGRLQANRSSGGT